MKVVSLFANIGVAEAYLDKMGINVVLANELAERRAALYHKIYPETEMICGDITDPITYQSLIQRAKELNVDTVMATPPCQGFSRAGKQNGKQDKNDVRNGLILSAISVVQDLQPKYVFIENVPQLTETAITVNGKKELIIEYINQTLGEKYHISINLIDTKNFSVPQTRQRTIILMTRTDQKKIWKLPEQDKTIISLDNAIGNLPSVDPFIKDVSEKELLEIFPNYYKKRDAALAVSIWHQPPTHIKRQVITMIHTPTGKTAFDNKNKYIPTKADGTPVTGYLSTYRRLRWCDPSSTVTMDNRKISSQNNVHPGRFLGNDSEGYVVYSDPRALTLFELMRVMSLPDDWPLPKYTNIPFVRSVIGEGIPPLFVKKVFKTII